MDEEGDGGTDPYLMSEQVLDMLKLLDYESKFCKTKGFKQIGRIYFAEAYQPDKSDKKDQTSQFVVFISLVSWLLSINNHQVSNWNKYDDPMTASQNVVLELKKLGVELDMPPNKLKSGFGDGVCLVLTKLCQISLQNKFKFRKAQIREDGGGMGDEDGDDMDNEFEGNADVADMAPGQKLGDDSDGGDIDEDLDFGGAGKHNEEQELLQQ